ncbi:hypothetical protein fugu_018613 [Takifugu bimaculatus]|uniref:Uncharacterized protein n=1 Tax=Takifugu bimaculatus TaxID=433685 RepID=A0A4Z2BLL6_9TELE|nr:hypothetical protein fugu_018613 [Takifugu bimaculatus]
MSNAQRPRVAGSLLQLDQRIILRQAEPVDQQNLRVTCVDGADANGNAHNPGVDPENKLLRLHRVAAEFESAAGLHVAAASAGEQSPHSPHSPFGPPHGLHAHTPGRQVGHGGPHDDAHDPRLQDGHERTPAAQRPARHARPARWSGDALRPEPPEHGGHAAAARHGRARGRGRAHERRPDGRTPPPDDVRHHDVQPGSAAPPHAPPPAAAGRGAPAAVSPWQPDVPAAHGQHAPAETQHSVPRAPAGPARRRPPAQRGAVPGRTQPAGGHAAHRRPVWAERHGHGPDRRGGSDLAGAGVRFGPRSGAAGTLPGTERI